MGHTNVLENTREGHFLRMNETNPADSLIPPQLKKPSLPVSQVPRSQVPPLCNAEEAKAPRESFLNGDTSCGLPRSAAPVFLFTSAASIYNLAAVPLWAAYSSAQQLTGSCVWRNDTTVICMGAWSLETKRGRVHAMYFVASLADNTCMCRPSEI